MERAARCRVAEMQGTVNIPTPKGKGAKPVQSQRPELSFAVFELSPSPPFFHILITLHLRGFFLPFLFLHSGKTSFNPLFDVGQVSVCANARAWVTHRKCHERRIFPSRASPAPPNRILEQCATTKCPQSAPIPIAGPAAIPQSHSARKKTPLSQKSKAATCWQSPS